MLQDIGCIAGGVPGIGDDVVGVFYHILISFDNSKLAGNFLHAFRVKSSIISFRQIDDSLGWMIRQKHS